jgi:hypothetical protein
MSHRGTILASVLLVVFGVLVLTVQVAGFNSKRLAMASVFGSLSMGEYLANTPDIVKRDFVVDPAPVRTAPSI